MKIIGFIFKFIRENVVDIFLYTFNIIWCCNYWGK